MPTLLQRIAMGDETAVHACVQEYGGLVWRLANRYLGRARGDVDDAVQEVFVELWLSASRFDPQRGSEPAFVATIAHRRLIDFQRKVSRRPHISSEGSPPAPETPRVSAMVRTEEYRALADEFDRLPDEERRVLWLSIHGGLSHRQIGEATETPVGTVKTRLRRGLRRLHEAIGRSPSLEMMREGHQ